MPTLSEVEDHKQAVAALSTLALADLADFWQALDVAADPKVVAQEVRSFTPELAAVYATATTTVAADWYDDLRTEAVAAVGFAASLLDPPSTDEIQDQLGYVLAPLFNGAAPEIAPAETFGHLSSLIEDVVTTADRQTVRANMAADRESPRYARHASANACAFCAMLATRGAEYRTEESATRVVLDRRRNKRKIGEKYHDNCHCTVVPVWGSKTYEEAPYVADWRDAYYAATAQVGTKDLSKILSLMRQSLDTN
jgi:hypothetical protein